MSKKVAFIGHRRFLPRDIDQRLKTAIANEITLGCKCFTMGTHGDFDLQSLNACKYLREKLKEIEIEIVITSLQKIKKRLLNNDEYEKEYYNPYSDVKTVMYDIECKHFKNQITTSNKQMIDKCDTLICYVRPNEYKSGAKSTMNYAKRKGLRIINLYKLEDEPFFGKSKEEKQKLFNEYLNSTNITPLGE